MSSTLIQIQEAPREAVVEGLSCSCCEALPTPVAASPGMRLEPPRVAHPLVAPSSLLDRPYSLVLRTSLALALLGGFGLGLYLILGIAGLGVAVSAGAPALMQVHGQVQTVGFVMLFVMAVGVQLFPRFHASRLDRPRWVSLGGLSVAAGVSARFVAQPLEPSAWRSAALLASVVLPSVGVLLAVAAFARVIRSGVSSYVEDHWARRLLPATMGASLLGSLALNAYAVALLVADGLPVVPTRVDEALLHLQLWGFPATMVLAVAGRVFPRFLILRATHERWLPAAFALWLAGSLGVPLAWLLAPTEPLARAAAWASQLLAVVLYLGALRLYEPPARASGMPHVTNPTRLWARIGFGFLVAAAAANLGLALDEAIRGSTFGLTSISAARHLMAQGFLLPVIVFMAGRILPGYSGMMLKHPRLLTVLLWTLFAGAAMRSSAVLLGGYQAGWGAAVALGGTLGVGAFTVFAFGLWRATGLAPRQVQ